MHDLSALVKRLESEKQELQAAVEEADSALEQGDTKLQQALADQTELRAETERRLAEKESEFDTTRYSIPTVPFSDRARVSFMLHSLLFVSDLLYNVLYNKRNIFIFHKGDYECLKYQFCFKNF